MFLHSRYPYNDWMMEDSLLQELEDAGWGEGTECPVSLGCCVPDLAELMVAVRTNKEGVHGHADFRLTYRRALRNWRASLIRTGIINSDGSSPEEAVARLWIRLNSSQ